MRIRISPRGDERGRHLMFVLSRMEYNNVVEVVQGEILGRTRRPNKTIEYEPGPGINKRISKVTYHFHIDYLDRLVCTFPQAELSPGIQRMIAKSSGQAGRDLITEDVPEIRVPGFKGKFWNFQKVSIAWMLDQLEEHDYCMLNDEVGLGKSVQVMSVIQKRPQDKKILFVTTTSGKWAMEKIAHRSIRNAPPMFPKLDMVPVDGLATQRRRQIAEDHRVTVVNHEMLRVKTVGRGSDATNIPAFPELINEKWDLVIIDEFHKFKNPDAQQTVGFMMLNFKKMIVMSGTPFINRPEELWSILATIAPEEWYEDYETFKNKLCIFDKSGVVIAYRYKYVKVIKKFLDEHSVRRRREQILKDLPAIVPITKLVELTSEQRRLYNKIRDEFKLELESGEVRTVANLRAQVIRLKQACISPELYGGTSKSAKIEELREIVTELVANGEKAIIFSEFSKATRIVQRELDDFNPAYVDGSVKGVKRLNEQDKFNEDPDCHVYIGTIRANQEAITLSAATYVIFLDKDWTPLANEQAAGRSAAGGLRGVHLGKGAKVFIIDLFAKDTIEEQIEELLKTKRSLFNAFIEKDGGKIVRTSVVKDLIRILEAA